MAEVERIPLQRAVAVIRDGSVAVRPSRAQLLGPIVQLGIAGGAVALIVLAFDALPLLVLALLLALAILLGPIAALGFVYSIVGSSVMLERRKQSIRWQQGLLGLGIGTSELVPFWRIARIEVAGDHDRELAYGGRQDLVTWDVVLVKDNDKRLTIGSVVVPRPLAGEGLARANRLAQALAERAEASVQLAELPAEQPLEASAAPRRRRRLVRVSPPRRPEAGP